MKTFKLPKYRKGTKVQLKSEPHLDGVVTKISEIGGLYWYSFGSLTGIGEYEIEAAK